MIKEGVGDVYASMFEMSACGDEWWWTGNKNDDDGMTHMMSCDVHLESLYQLRCKVVC